MDNVRITKKRATATLLSTKSTHIVLLIKLLMSRIKRPYAAWGSRRIDGTRLFYSMKCFSGQKTRVMKSAVSQEREVSNETVVGKAEDYCFHN